MSVKLRWDGDIVKVLAKKVVNKTAYETGLIVEGQAKLLCARKYGYLAASITTRSQTDGTEVQSPSKYAEEKAPADHDVASFVKIDPSTNPNEVLVGTQVDYAPWVEIGTKRMDAQPFLRPALDLAQGFDLNLAFEKGKWYFADYLRRPA